MDCIFCKIIHKEIPARIVFEDEHTVAFLDIVPTNPGHTLVVPKEHYADVLSTPDETLQKVITTVKRVARAVSDGLHGEGFNILQNNGTVAGQVVGHLHFHIVPRRQGDGFEHWKGTRYATDQEADAVAEKIKLAMI